VLKSVRLDLPSTNPVDSTPVFAVDSQVHEIFGPAAETTPGTIQFADRSVDATTVDRAIAHAICYDRKARPNSVYPKCIACGLPGHTIEKCHPLINHCIAQALAAQHPEIVKRIKATCKMFPRSARGRPARPATVTQLIAELDLDRGVYGTGWWVSRQGGGLQVVVRMVIDGARSSDTGSQ
jgi:hypothetical protein